MWWIEATPAAQSDGTLGWTLQAERARRDYAARWTEWLRVRFSLSFFSFFDWPHSISRGSKGMWALFCSVLDLTFISRNKEQNAKQSTQKFEITVTTTGTSSGICHNERERERERAEVLQNKKKVQLCVKVWQMVSLTLNMVFWNNDSWREI